MCHSVYSMFEGGGGYHKCDNHEELKKKKKAGNLQCKGISIYRTAGSETFVIRGAPNGRKLKTVFKKYIFIYNCIRLFNIMN